ncbi:hypothetical protein [Dokdonella soli]|uniref:Uncharacterized protein n=1 Tax=Dokdonella soli TaxID=529810 RepID=A0ABN1IBL4_9GAMM
MVFLVKLELFNRLEKAYEKILDYNAKRSDIPLAEAEANYFRQRVTAVAWQREQLNQPQFASSLPPCHLQHQGDCNGYMIFAAHILIEKGRALAEASVT